MGGFAGRVGRVGRRRADHPRFPFQQAVDFLDRITEAVEEDDIVDRHLGLAAAVGPLGEKGAGFRNTLGGAVGVGAVGHRQVGDDLFHPLRDNLAFGDRVADVFHVGVDAERLELVGDFDDGADLVSQLAGTDVNNIVAHEIFLSTLPVEIKKAMGVCPWP